MCDEFNEWEISQYYILIILGKVCQKHKEYLNYTALGKVFAQLFAIAPILTKSGSLSFSHFTNNMNFFEYLFK